MIQDTMDTEDTTPIHAQRSTPVMKFIRKRQMCHRRGVASCRKYHLRRAAGRKLKLRLVVQFCLKIAQVGIKPNPFRLLLRKIAPCGCLVTQQRRLILLYRCVGCVGILYCREPPLERVPGLYAALLMSADAMDANDMTGVRGPKQSCFVDIEKVIDRW